MAPETHEALTYGCYVVTTALKGRRFGMTCCWATQIECDKVMVCLGGQSTTGKAIRESGIFGVNVLKASQKDLALRFGKGHSDDIDKFDGLVATPGMTGVPLLPGSIKTIECQLEKEDAFLNKNLFVGKILHYHRSDATEIPLLLWHIDGPQS